MKLSDVGPVRVCCIAPKGRRDGNTKKNVGETRQLGRGGGACPSLGERGSRLEGGISIDSGVFHVHVIVETLERKTRVYERGGEVELTSWGRGGKGSWQIAVPEYN